MTDSLDELTERLRDFAAARDWEQFHTPKNLAMALSVEVAELVEIFQWLTPEESADVMSNDRADDVRDELADVLIYLTRLADILNVDLAEAAIAKIDLNEQRFPRRATVRRVAWVQLVGEAPKGSRLTHAELRREHYAWDVSIEHHPMSGTFWRESLEFFRTFDEAFTWAEDKADAICVRFVGPDGRGEHWTRGFRGHERTLPDDPEELHRLVDETERRVLPVD